MAQCVLFDGNTVGARMMGVEYIISEKPYNTLPSDEKAYWHPHNYEILSGQLLFNRDGEGVPGMVAERDKRMSFDAADEKKDREDLVSLAKPQGGVDAMAGLFPNAKPVPGVTDNGDAATRPVPTFSMKNGQGKPTGR